MFSPFKKNKKYFIKTVTFYYIGTLQKQCGGFLKFTDVKWIENVPDWQDFWKSRPSLPPSMKAHDMPTLHINADAIVDMTLWE
jgi:hypothetical protein